uniref:Ovule protein n=1 Tax=Rhabditophanes sp. KR3021 TaxID=114890 RepID=A0AC35U260_9BILA
MDSEDIVSMEDSSDSWGCHPLQCFILGARIILSLMISCFVIRRIWFDESKDEKLKAKALKDSSDGNANITNTKYTAGLVENGKNDEIDSSNRDEREPMLCEDVNLLDEIEEARMSTSERMTALNFVDLSQFDQTRGSIFSASSFNSFASRNGSFATNKSTDAFLPLTCNNEDYGDEFSPVKFSDIIDSPVRRDHNGLVETPKSIYRGTNGKKKSRFLF